MKNIKIEQKLLLNCYMSCLKLWGWKKSDNLLDNPHKNDIIFVEWVSILNGAKSPIFLWSIIF
ncbi:hypothetical protein SU69_07440 [Thermosipho melanesiensis]|uniref:Uncharacterized protein n=1 Tax=Thermosipho melanesiensis TaxID=46541 RepID=A0ABM6GGZ7_9BACT|nr:hypothetical protein BW47_07775 [Thermosipho melanesiensis]OOC36334.1 hypothetical protein SU68_07510 [Thermosipho melanesiensis]OOC37152.1 hypothetical protein SU69_07440 [Thermosipho melanesiensis]OOC37904.1 hypothetical protein SU70_07450 [Thermosipho melanesiensis]OOC41131.1 hypothetical protein SU71_07430 [Thermosipho melanesiensis]